MSDVFSSLFLLEEEQLRRSPELRNIRLMRCMVLDKIFILSNAYVRGEEVSLLGYARQAFALEGFEGVDRDHVVIDGLTIVELGLE